MKRKLTLLIFIFSSIFSIVKAQNWGGGIDGEQLNFGFTFQYVAAEYKILKTADFTTINSALTGNRKSISSPVAGGFGIGFVINKRITENVDLRLTPTLVFNDRKMLYTYENTDEATTKKYQATMFEWPVGIKIKSERLMNFRAYMIGGLKYSFDMASSKKINNNNEPNELKKNLVNKKNFLSYEAGLGMDFYFEWFKMSPELKVSYSLKDIIKHEGNVFDSPIDKAKLRHFTFSLFFE